LKPGAFNLLFCLLVFLEKERERKRGRERVGEREGEGERERGRGRGRGRRGRMGRKLRVNWIPTGFNSPPHLDV
jgi:hypothetical protein